ncbi:MAG: ABC transporter substrate-binding protein [Litorilinea sp.]
MLHSKSRWRRMLHTLGLVALLALLAACSTPPAAPPADTPGDTAPASDDPTDSTSEATSETTTDDATRAYHEQRALCSWEDPCWPEISDTVPAEFHEAPMLAARVEAGELPPVAERLPTTPLVIQPAEMIGDYGGTWRRAFTGPGDRQNFERMNTDYAIFWDTNSTELRPRIVQAWESNEDTSQWTFHLREGTRWSDGEPLTADDYVFWYEHLFTNDQIVPTPPWYLTWGGDLTTVEKVDDYTFTFTFAAPFPTWPETMATSTVAGHFNMGWVGLGLVAPQHYLEQFHADFVGEDEANALASEAGFENWQLHLLSKNDAHMNPDLPVLTQWEPVTTIASNEYVLERNPYFWAVDTEGNQLPYIDRISAELVEELEVLNLNAIAGNYTIQGRHIDFAKLPVIRANQEAGDYFVDFWVSLTRHQAKIAFNQDWNEDPALAEMIQNRDFRKALSLAIERSEINETYFLGAGREASFCPQDTPPFFNSDRWDEEFGRFDPEEANQILDALGLDQRDADGFRLLPNGDPLQLAIDAVSGAFIPYPEIAESVGQTWAQHLGINLQVNPVERSLWTERMGANQPMMNIFATGDYNPEVLPRLLPTERWAPVAAAWGSTPNPDPADYDGPQWIKDLVLKHWEAVQEPDPQLRRQLFIEGTEIMCDNQARLGMVVDVPDLTVIIKNNVRNVPFPIERNVYAQTPAHAYPETWSLVQE